MEFLRKAKEQLDTTSKEKEKDGKKGKNKNKKTNALEEMFNAKEKELKHYIAKNKSKEKEIERLQKELDSKVNLEQVTNLKNQIQLAAKKNEELDKIIEEMEPIRLEHEKCEEEKNRIKNEINNLKESLKEIRKTNRKTFKKEEKDKRKVMLHNNMSQLYKDLNEEEIKNLKEQQIKKKGRDGKERKF